MNAPVTKPAPLRRNAYDIAAIRSDFPILATKVRGKPLTFLDSGASAQKPRQVMDAMRSTKSANGGTEVVDVDLFPAISIGDAPVRH